MSPRGRICKWQAERGRNKKVEPDGTVDQVEQHVFRLKLQKMPQPKKNLFLFAPTVTTLDNIPVRRALLDSELSTAPHYAWTPVCKWTEEIKTDKGGNRHELTTAPACIIAYLAHRPHNTLTSAWASCSWHLLHQHPLIQTTCCRLTRTHTLRGWDRDTHTHTHLCCLSCSTREDRLLTVFILLKTNLYLMLDRKLQKLAY